MSSYLKATRVAHESSQDGAVDADGDIQMRGVTSPILELSPRTQAQGSEGKSCKKVRFEDLPEKETNDGVVGSPILGILASVRKPPIGIEDPFDFREDLRKNFNQTKYTR